MAYGRKREMAGGRYPSSQKDSRKCIRRQPQYGGNMARCYQTWYTPSNAEIETGQIDNAREFLKQAREKANTARVWMKSAVLERQTKNYQKALEILEQGLLSFPDFPKLWMIKGQILSGDTNDIEGARSTYSKALKHHPKSVTLWILASRLEEQAGSFIKARATLEKARILNPQSDELYLESIHVETRAGNAAMAKALLAKSLQTCSSSGILWSQAILLKTRPQRKARSADALKKCENDPVVVQTIARLFWSERKTDKARNWFSRAAKTDPDLGDTWAWWLKFEMMHGTPEQQADVRKGCIAAQPRHGERWQLVSKNLDNVGMTHGDILDLVASKLENIF
jgi:pre-mRNA-processing factor 6